MIILFSYLVSIFTGLIVLLPVTFSIPSSSGGSSPSFSLSDGESHPLPPSQIHQQNGIVLPLPRPFDYEREREKLIRKYENKIKNSKNSIKRYEWLKEKAPILKRIGIESSIIYHQDQIQKHSILIRSARITPIRRPFLPWRVHHTEQHRLDLSSSSPPPSTASSSPNLSP